MADESFKSGFIKHKRIVRERSEITLNNSITRGTFTFDQFQIFFGIFSTAKRTAKRVFRYEFFQYMIFNRISLEMKPVRYILRIDIVDYF